MNIISWLFSSTKPSRGTTTLMLATTIGALLVVQEATYSKHWIIMRLILFKVVEIYLLLVIEEVGD